MDARVVRLKDLAHAVRVVDAIAMGWKVTATGKRFSLVPEFAFSDVEDVSVSAFEAVCHKLLVMFAWDSAVGYFNHFSCRRQMLCLACRYLVAITGHLDVRTPVPVHCKCRAVCPEGVSGGVRFVSCSTPGADYDDWAVNGGVHWIFLDWEMLLLKPLLKASDRGDLRVLSFLVNGLRYYLRLKRWGLSPEVKVTLKSWGFLTGEDELLEYLSRVYVRVEARVNSCGVVILPIDLWDVLYTDCVSALFH
jgi:hypothetical protein